MFKLETSNQTSNYVSTKTAHPLLEYRSLLCVCTVVWFSLSITHGKSPPWVIGRLGDYGGGAHDSVAHSTASVTLSFKHLEGRLFVSLLDVDTGHSC